MLNSTVCSVKNTVFSLKPNEDAYFADDDMGIYIIADGVSRDIINGFYPNPSPSKEVATIFVEEASEYVTQYMSTAKDYQRMIYDAFAHANRKIQLHNTSYTCFFPGTVGIIVFVKDNSIYYGYIGDCTGLLLNSQEMKVFTHCQTEQIYIHRKEFTKDIIRKKVCNNLSHPYSYGVIDGRNAAMGFVVTGVLSISGYSGMILHSDGATEIVNSFSASELLSMTACRVLYSFPTNNNKDDKTLILVKMR